MMTHTTLLVQQVQQQHDPVVFHKISLLHITIHYTLYLPPGHKDQHRHAGHVEASSCSHTRVARINHTVAAAEKTCIQVWPGM